MAVETVNVTLAVPLLRLTELELSVATGLLWAIGLTLEERVTSPLNPLTLLRVMVEVPLLPRTIVMLDGLAVMVKKGPVKNVAP